eukprot:2849622-Karenia_brevis.AAC.1
MHPGGKLKSLEVHHLETAWTRSMEQPLLQSVWHDKQILLSHVFWSLQPPQAAQEVEAASDVSAFEEFMLKGYNRLFEAKPRT